MSHGQFGIAEREVCCPRAGVAWVLSRRTWHDIGVPPQHRRARSLPNRRCWSHCDIMCRLFSVKDLRVPLCCRAIWVGEPRIARVAGLGQRNPTQSHSATAEQRVRPEVNSTYTGPYTGGVGRWLSVIQRCFVASSAESRSCGSGAMTARIKSRASSLTPRLTSASSGTKACW